MSGPERGMDALEAYEAQKVAVSEAYWKGREDGAAEAWKAAADWADQAGWPMNTAAPVLRIRAATPDGGE